VVHDDLRSGRHFGFNKINYYNTKPHLRNHKSSFTNWSIVMIMNHFQLVFQKNNHSFTECFVNYSF